MNEKNMPDGDNNDGEPPSKRSRGDDTSNNFTYPISKPKMVYTDMEMFEILEAEGLNGWHKNRDLFLAAIKVFGLRQVQDNKEVRDNKEIVSLAVVCDPYALNSASNRLKDDREVVTIAVTNHPQALEYASDRLKNDDEIVRLAVSKKGWWLSFASYERRNDKDLVAYAVTHDAVHSLMYASDELKNDRDIVKLAVTIDGRALNYASNELQNDRELVFCAVAQNGLSLEYASTELQNDRELVFCAIAKNGLSLKYASAELQNDRELVYCAVTFNGWSLEYASAELQDDYMIVSIAVTENGEALEYASPRMRSDKHIVMLAIEQDGAAFTHAKAALRGDPEIIAAAASYFVNRNTDAYMCCVPPEFRQRIRNINEALAHDTNELPSLEDAINEGVWKTFAEEKWRYPVYEIIWLIGKIIEDPNDEVPHDMIMPIVEYAELGEKIHLAKELSALAFLYRKFALAGWNWNDIPINVSFRHYDDSSTGGDNSFE